MTFGISSDAFPGECFDGVSVEGSVLPAQVEDIRHCFCNESDLVVDCFIGYAGLKVASIDRRDLDILMKCG
jgi:hypothetical protein